jgi:hypothetical protein
MGAWTTGKGPKRRGRKKEASKEASGAECVWAVGLCLWGGTGERRGSPGCLAGGRWRDRAGRLQKEGLVAHVLSCRIVRMCISTTLPSPSTKRNAACGARAMTSADSMDRRLYLLPCVCVRVRIVCSTIICLFDQRHQYCDKFLFYLSTTAQDCD